MTNDSLRETLAAITGIPADQITDATELHPGEWDSIQVLDVIAAIDATHHVTVANDEMMRSRSFGDLRALIERAIASL